MCTSETTSTGTVLTPNNAMLKAYKNNSGRSMVMSNGGGGVGGTTAAVNSSGAGIDEPDVTQTEKNPTIYEELKLRSEGAGFKKLVS